MCEDEYAVMLANTPRDGKNACAPSIVMMNILRVSVVLSVGAVVRTPLTNLRDRAVIRRSPNQRHVYDEKGVKGKRFTRADVGSGRGVLVEAFAGLDTELAGVDVGVQQLPRPVG